MKERTLQNPYSVILSLHITEKANVLSQLESATSNKSVARCSSPKRAFIVDPRANKHQIAAAIEEIYRPQNVKVVKVNVLNVRRKPRRVRGRAGFKAGFKKAYVTFEPGDRIEEV